MSRIRIVVNTTVDVPVSHFTFSGGEEQVKIETKFMPETDIGTVDVHAFVQSSSDLIRLALVVDALRRLPKIHPHAVFSLHLPYVPYARQDRVMNPGEALASVWLSNFINSLEFHRVYIQDPHSGVAEAGLKNVVTKSQAAIAFADIGWKIRYENFILCSPDAGATKKTEELAKMMGITEIVTGKKIRDVTTGEITGTTFTGDSVEGRNVMMVDDICDGGMTFIKLGEVLKRAGARQVELYVTHGIFSKGSDVFAGTVDSVYAHNVWEQNIEGRNTFGIFKPIVKK